MSSKRGTANIITGYLSVDKFSLAINIVLDQGATDVTFSGTFDGTSLKGSISVLGLSIDFTGVKPGKAVATEILGGAQ